MKYSLKIVKLSFQKKGWIIVIYSTKLKKSILDAIRIQVGKQFLSLHHYNFQVNYTQEREPFLPGKKLQHCFGLSAFHPTSTNKTVYFNIFYKNFLHLVKFLSIKLKILYIKTNFSLILCKIGNCEAPSLSFSLILCKIGVTFAEKLFDFFYKN